mmetsp:Transcript_30255/g.76100  ORF Transcript_30255/g.76100 Transcript_30255/m.76100 type:complete len:463 (-) Transcript_30255:11-1399(-)
MTEPMQVSGEGDVQSKEMDTCESSTVGRAAVALNEENLLPMLKIYYSRLFPYRQMFQWLSYCSTDDDVAFRNREFSFTYPNDIYSRWNSFKTVAALKEHLIDGVPVKLDIGPVYPAPAKDHNSYPKNFDPVQREVVFDIDMDDYDSVRTCCEGATVCHCCWRFMAAAVAVLERTLREDFGLKHLLWVYSGRRGVHCWVADENARQWTDPVRRSVVRYLSLMDGATVDFGPYHHPMVKKSVAVLRPIFEEHIIEEQQVFENPKTYKLLLSMLPAAMSESLHEEWQKSSLSGKHKWVQLQKTIQKAGKKSKRGYDDSLDSIEDKIICAFTYPRLDTHVSASMGHLLKSPFCVHPKTGRICVPFDPQHATEFNPLRVVELPQLLEQLDEWAEKHPSPVAETTDDGEDDDSSKSTLKQTNDISKTGMADAVEVFERCFLKPLTKSIRAERIKQREASEAASLGSDP